MSQTPLTVHRLKRVPGTLAKDRLIVKGFKTADQLFRFMTGPDNNGNQWRQTKEFPTIAGTDISGLKQGTYAYAGGRWHNTKSLDATTLAHI